LKGSTRLCGDDHATALCAALEAAAQASGDGRARLLLMALERAIATVCAREQP
jgi:hypothetical protein